MMLAAFGGAGRAASGRARRRVPGGDARGLPTDATREGSSIVREWFGAVVMRKSGDMDGFVADIISWDRLEPILCGLVGGPNTRACERRAAVVDFALLRRTTTSRACGTLELSRLATTLAPSPVVMAGDAMLVRTVRTTLLLGGSPRAQGPPDMGRQTTLGPSLRQVHAQARARTPPSRLGPGSDMRFGLTSAS